jgi:hypothetical protein
MCATCPAQLILLYLMNLPIFGEEHKSLSNPPPPPTSFSILLLHPSSLAQMSSLAPYSQKNISLLSSLNPLKTTINLHYMWVWLLITSLISKSTLIMSRVGFDSLGTIASNGPTVADLNHWWNYNWLGKPTCLQKDLRHHHFVHIIHGQAWAYSRPLQLDAGKYLRCLVFFIFTLSAPWPGLILHHASMWSSVISLSTFNELCYVLGEVSVYFHPTVLNLYGNKSLWFHTQYSTLPNKFVQTDRFSSELYEQNVTRGNANLVLFNFLSSLVTWQQRALNTYCTARFLSIY